MPAMQALGLSEKQENVFCGWMDPPLHVLLSLAMNNRRPRNQMPSSKAVLLESQIALPIPHLVRFSSFECIQCSQ